MTAPNKIIELVERFENNIESYKKGIYNETQVRREFIDPFFKELGWDIDNEQGYAEAYKDVIHEFTIKDGSATKAPDYCFKIGRDIKFFIEAKKPSVNIKDDIHPAFQLRRYAWSAKLPLSILTDFEEFAVYDCRKGPIKTDKPSHSRILLIEYKEYPEKWEEISGIFSKEAVLKGSFDKYVESNKSKKGTAEVDDAFLEEIERWRDIVARNIALRNPDLNHRELNFAVQRTIDRIIFLRICEDRGIESYGTLMALRNGTNVYKRLLEIFRKADDVYNSGLFHFRQEKGRTDDYDALTPKLEIDDKVLKDIFKNLYSPDSPYAFSVIPADILGQVYEQFLGKVIRLTAGHRAVVEEKPEVRKVGGVYYTPTYIVDYIVKQTVGKLVEGKKPGPKGAVSKIKILDPACGSGSFLIGVYQYLLDWHLEAYVNDDPQKWSRRRNPRISFTPQGDWKLTIDERKRILIDHIFGVDIDAQAVEVTKLSLLIKVIEGHRQLSFLRERVLPDLGSNIKCGNSLIETDIYIDQRLDFQNNDEIYRINAFDWQTKFSDVISGGGFDAIIGNPPYGYMISAEEQEYFQKKYKCQSSYRDYYLLFLERYESFLKQNGLLGVIVSNTWLQSVTMEKIRQYLTRNYIWLSVLNLPEKVFKAVVDTHVLIFEKENDLDKIRSGDFSVYVRKDGKMSKSHELPLKEIPRDGSPINVVFSHENQKLFRKIQMFSEPLSQSFKVFNGVKPFEKGKGKPPQTKQVVKEKPYVKKGDAPDSSWSPLLRGGLIKRYTNLWNKDYWIKYGPWLAAQRDPSIFESELKIMVRQTGDSIIATLIEKGFVARNNMHIILRHTKSYAFEYLLGVINSRLMDFAYYYINPEKGEALAEVKKKHVEQLPIRKLDLSDSESKKIYDEIVFLVRDMLELNRKLKKINLVHEKEVISTQIEITDRSIDQIVYRLYELTDEEIKIVEESFEN